MVQGSLSHISEEVTGSVADFAIAYEDLELFGSLAMMPCYHWNRCILVPKDHPLVSIEKITLEYVVNHSIVTYPFGHQGRSKRSKALHEHDLTPKIVFTATDAEIIKTYVRLGLGVGIIAYMAYDKNEDSDLVPIEASHLFEPSVTSIGICRSTYLRGYMYDFIEASAPHFTRTVVQDVMALTSRAAQTAYFAELEVPIYSITSG
jgi:LysR family cys regulon transcriptional activator